MERCDYVNDSLKLIQNTSGLTFGTDALLLAGYIGMRGKKGCELGAGSGIISMLLLTRGKLSEIDAVEVQPEYAELSARNAELNGLTEKMRVIAADIREFGETGAYDTVFTNPPYMKTDTGKANLNDKKNIARHEVFGSIYDFCAAAKRLLKFGGSFYAVYRPDRTADLIDAMRKHGLEPKRMTLVYADTESEPSMLLIEGRMGGGCGMKMTAPFIIYKDGSHTELSDNMNYVYENGVFPTPFLR